MTDKSKATIIKGDNNDSTNSNNSVSHDFTKIVRHFKKYAKFIKRLSEDTDKSYGEIHEKRILSQGKQFLCFFFDY